MYEEDKSRKPHTYTYEMYFRFLKTCHQKFNLIFADPPSRITELETIPNLIFEHNLLSPDGIFVFEHGKSNDFSNNPHFIEHRNYGSVKLLYILSKVPVIPRIGI